jgi:hypothetical protein
VDAYGQNNETDASDEAQGVTLDDAKTGAGLRSRRLTALRDKSELLGVLHLFDGHHYRVALGWVMVISEMQIYAVRYHVDNVFLVPFAAATKHFQTWSRLTGFIESCLCSAFTAYCSVPEIR